MFMQKKDNNKQNKNTTLQQYNDQKIVFLFLRFFAGFFLEAVLAGF